jgi:lipoprotein NlpD
MLSSGFGKRERGHHDGIDISTPKGTPVYAARDGKVIFSDRLSSYGNVIIVEHGDGFTTVYAHNENNLVRKGSRIRRGERIATVGQTGRARGSHLHFEIRKDNVARNPLYYLPRASAASVAAAQ